MLHFIDSDGENMQKCVDYLSEISVIGLDIETQRKHPKGTYNECVYKAGLDPYLSRICMLQIGDLEEQYVIDCRTVDISPLLSIFSDKTKLFVGHNLIFEAMHLKTNYGIILYNIYDTFLVEINLTNGLGKDKDNSNGLRYSLEALAERYLGIRSAKKMDLFTEDDGEEYVDKSIRLQFIEWGDAPFTKSQVEYGKNDIIYPLKIKELQKENKWYSQYLNNLENEFCLVLSDIMVKGIGFNSEEWLNTYKQKVPIFEKRLAKLNKYVIDNKHLKFCQLPDLFSSDTKCSILWSSSDQVIKYFKFLGFCPQEKSKQTKRTEYTVGAKALLKLLNSEYIEKYMQDVEVGEIKTQEDLILSYLLMKTAEQAITTFGEDFLKYIHPITGRIHTSYKQILNTGRISSNKPNIQNIPAEPEYRRAFIPCINNKMICADYSSMESRVVADVAGDEALISFFNDGHPIFKDDIHSFTATKMFSLMRNEPDLIISKKTHPKERQDAKTIGFKIIYGGSAYTLKNDFGVTEDVAQEFIDGYFKAFPKIKENLDRNQKKVLQEGYIMIDDITKRVWFDKDFYSLKERKDKVLKLYPRGYSQLPDEKKQKTKEELYKKHPEIPQFWKDYRTIQGKVQRNASNYIIQGLAASQTKMAGILVRRHLLENNLQNDIFVVNLIHDELTTECKKEQAEYTKKLIKDCMIEGANIFMKNVKMDAEAQITDYWSK